MEQYCTISKDDQRTLLNDPNFAQDGCQYIIMYMARIHSQAEFIFAKILDLRGRLYSDFEAAQIVEAFTIKTVCDWEWFVEKIFCECLKDNTSQLALSVGLDLPKTISIDECVYYLNGRGYFDIKNATDLMRIAKQILVKEKNPFTNIKSDTKNRIDNFYILRNYATHMSRKSKMALLKMYKGYNQTEFVEVGTFLLAKEKSTDKQIRYQIFGGAFWLAAFNLLEFLYPSVYKWVVQDEKIYNEQCHLRFHYLMHISPNQPQ